MPKRLSAFVLVVFVLGQEALYGQYSLKGQLRDTVFSKDCALAVIALIRPDSTLVRYTRSRKDGSFSIQGIAPGDYLLLASHPMYNPYYRAVQVKPGSDGDLGMLPILPRPDSLAPVMVTPRSLVPKLRGDTLEYNTAHVKMRVNATVEELLHRLPGLEVDPDGNITINGQKVERLLVDGKDFFGGDPTIVTRNFNGDMIAKVQVLDKKSQQSEFTGVDDSKRTKTVNLVLKEDSKRGTLMKVEAGGDTEDYYNVGGLLGAFNGDMQFAALGMTGNTGTSSFSGDIGGRSTGLTLRGASYDALGASAGMGIPAVAGAGLHFGNDWNGNADHLVANYQYGRVMTSPYSTNFTRQVLSDSIYVQQQESNSENTMEQHGFYGTYDFSPDSLSSYHFSLGGNTMEGNNAFHSSGVSLFNDIVVNDSRRNILSHVQNDGMRGNLMWRMRARKNKVRGLSVTVGLDRKNTSTNGFLFAFNDFYQPSGNLLRVDTMDQRKLIDMENLIFNSSINYTEPIRRGMVLALSYGISHTSSRSNQATYARGDGKYNALIDSLSTRYRNTVWVQQATVNLQFSKGNVQYVMGGDLQQYNYRQSDLLNGTNLVYRYLSFAPRIEFNIVMNSRKGISIDYRGATEQPSITQLQPVQNNNDPLHITLGNPHLHGSFSHYMDIRFANYDAHNLYIALALHMTTNSISTKTYTDTLGRQVSQAVNVNGSPGADLNISYRSRIKSINVNMDFNTNLSYARSVNYINEFLSRNDNYMAGGSVDFNKFTADKYSFNVKTYMAYTFSNSSINPSGAVHYWSQTTSGQLSFFPIPGWEINSSAGYSWRQRLDNFDKRNSTLLWNAYIGKDFLKNQLTIRWQINDILSKNIGLSRTTTANQTSESTVNALGRLWLLKASYRLVRHRRLK